MTTITVTEVWVAAATDPREFFERTPVTPVTEGHNVTFLQAGTDAPLAFRQRSGGLWIVNRFRLYADLSDVTCAAGSSKRIIYDERS